MQDAEIKLAKANGTYDDCGIIKPHGESIAFRKKEVCTTAYMLPVLSNTLVAVTPQPRETDGRHSLSKGLHQLWSQLYRIQEHCINVT